MDSNERRICVYSSLLIALMVNSGRLLALREHGIVAQYWHFNFWEYSFQLLYNLAFCILLFYINLGARSPIARYRQQHYITYYLYNGLFIMAAMLTGNALQYFLFANGHLPGVFWMGYFARFGLSAIMIGIVVRIILLLRESRQKDREHEQLKTSYLEAQLELLKEQLNPHLLFNSLSSLSGIVREDPTLAQFYIGHLSKVFRHALLRPGTTLVTVADELQLLPSFEALLNMRFEKGFRLEVQVDAPYLTARIPHLSLQPLLENAAKHNAALPDSPLVVKVYVQDDWLIVHNNLQEIAVPEHSTGIGLLNLNERFRLLLHQEIEIEKTTNAFIVKLPLPL
ncbi:Histidine kinase [Chitinophaga costaii]|uniref:Histidine kinase n=1 Tax=Chitinophaga costaii TaxID=1335309 RepID=A0A1C4EZL2_9BACT|nr:histidine kinase [Chitinophaga costaii]PUZ21513.1 histidine kinase [Chitinophaga costaii]SCC49054.1 Histidine kinase [Chitinophaga costaii]